MTVATGTFMGTLKCSEAKKLHESKLEEHAGNTLAKATATTLLFQVATGLKVCFICQGYAGCWLLGAAL